MFKHKKVFILICYIGFWLLISCKNDKQDTSKPFINILSPTTTEVLNVYSDEEFLTELYFKDNKELSQYRALVKSDFENSILPDVDNSIARPFTLVYVKNINALEAKETLKIKVNQNSISGNYKLIFDCVDASGNQAESVSLNFIIKNKRDSLAPDIKIITPIESEQFGNNTSVLASVLIEDFRSDFTKGFVYDFNIKVFKMSDNTEVYNLSQKINKISPQSFRQQIPLISDPGEYLIKVTSRDDYNNLSEVNRIFRIL